MNTKKTQLCGTSHWLSHLFRSQIPETPVNSSFYEKKLNSLLFSLIKRKITVYSKNKKRLEGLIFWRKIKTRYRLECRRPNWVLGPLQDCLDSDIPVEVHSRLDCRRRSWVLVRDWFLLLLFHKACWQQPEAILRYLQFFSFQQTSIFLFMIYVKIWYKGHCWNKRFKKWNAYAFNKKPEKGGVCGNFLHLTSFGLVCSLCLR